jgi:multiple sugar transport system substrate-binding protein
MKRNKFWVLVVSLAVMSMVVAGCVVPAPTATPEKPVEAKVTATPEKPLAGKRITVVAIEGDPIYAALTKAYTERTGLEFDLVALPYGMAYEKELLNLSQGTAGYDVLTVDDPWWPQFAGSGWLTPLQPYFEARGLSGPDKDFVARPQLLSRWPSTPDGELYGITAIGNVQLFVYRKDLAEKYDLLPLDTWDQVWKAAEIIEKNEPGMKGYVMRGVKTNPAASEALPVFWGFGCDLFDKFWVPQTGSEKCLQAFKYYDQLAALHAPPGVATFDGTEVVRALGQGAAAMAIAWPGWAYDLGNPEVSKTAGLWDWKPAPVQPGEEGGALFGVWMWAIPKGSEKKDLAFDYILWATGPEGQKIQAMLGTPPTRESVFNDPDVLKKYPYFTAVLESQKVARVRPRTPLWGKVEEVFGTHISAMLARIETPEEASKLITQGLTDIMVSGGVIPKQQ